MEYTCEYMCVHLSKLMCFLYFEVNVHMMADLNAIEVFNFNFCPNKECPFTPSVGSKETLSLI